MAFTSSPEAWLPGLTANTGDHTLRFTTGDASGDKSLPNLTDAEADPTTGDIRMVSLSICEALRQAWLTQDPDLPTTMTVSMTAMTSRVGKLLYTYHFGFQITPPTSIVIPDEP